MKIHAVAGQGNSKVCVRNTSCYCGMCVSLDSVCETWRLECLTKDKAPARRTLSDENHQLDSSSNTQQIPELSREISYSIDEYVAAHYCNQWYIGEIQDVDDDDKEIEVSFMQSKKRLFQWPTPPDIIWVKYNDVISKIAAPSASGKSRRMFSMKAGDRERVEQLFTV